MVMANAECIGAVFELRWRVKCGRAVAGEGLAGWLQSLEAVGGVAGLLGCVVWRIYQKSIGLACGLRVVATRRKD